MDIQNQKPIEERTLILMLFENQVFIINSKYYNF